MERTSTAVAHLLRSRRRELGLRLRDVKTAAAAEGQVIPISTLSRIERGQVEPGQRRLGLLLRLYRVPYEVVGDLLELEARSGDAPEETAPEVLYEDGVAAWKSGDMKTALAYLMALQRVVPEDQGSRYTRHLGLLAFGYFACILGKPRLGWEVIEGVLREGPHEKVLVTALVQAASAWQGLGSLEVALAFLGRAEGHLQDASPKQRGDVYQSKAVMLTLSGDLEGAERALRTAVEAHAAIGSHFARISALALRVRIAFARDDPKAALNAAREVRDEAKKHGFGDIVTQRDLDEARALLALGDPERSLEIAKKALADAIRRDDHETRFRAHFRLWKTYAALGQAGLAAIELEGARQFVGFVEEATEEADEVRNAT